MRVKINNIDEFCEALKAGYKITDNNGVHVVSLGKSINIYGIGFAFDFPDMYYEKPDPLKIECRKYYKMRNDKLACVCFYSRRFETDAFIGLMESGLEMSWSPDGKSTTNESDYDLVSEWKED